MLRPAYSSHFALSDYPAIGHPKVGLSGRQNLAALCTATGENLAAVGSSHSLTESVDLGTVTVAGLVGTLHSDTPPQKSICSTVGQTDRSGTNSRTIIGHAKVL